MSDIQLYRDNSGSLPYLSHWAAKEPAKHRFMAGNTDHWAKMKHKVATFSIRDTTGQVKTFRGDRMQHEQHPDKKSQDKLLKFRHEIDGTLTRIGGPNFSDILVKELHGNLPGDYYKPRPLPPKLLRTAGKDLEHSVNNKLKLLCACIPNEKASDHSGFKNDWKLNSEGKLNVFLEAKEVSRFLYDLNTNLFLVKDGTVASMLKTPSLSSLIPPIEPYIKDLKFRFSATGRVQYRLSFQSSNETIMKHPTASIPLSGLVPKKTRGNTKAK
ncbi:hypothetical protein P5673_007648 [Acropora cervicornis]|uniref:WIF domain-containing protein n=1 Tax=Acropora cervicornis TaxID=6130 RepID=A0AAD9QUK1_ACRCE|nr:hypothetical protein P5673_007648 [Acropora cervicornis]